jgi:acyl carrier protein
MNDQEILNELHPIFREVFGNDRLQITPDTTAHDIKEWVSLTHMQLIAAVEDHFRCEFTFYEVMEFRNVGDMIAAIKLKKHAV